MLVLQRCTIASELCARAVLGFNATLVDAIQYPAMVEFQLLIPKHVQVYGTSAWSPAHLGP